LGARILITESKNSQITLPRNPLDPSELAKDYANSPFHRYKVPGSRNEKHVCAPSAQLHVANLPEQSNAEDVKAFFSQDEEKALSAKIFGPKGNMAFVQYGTPSEGTQALIRYHLAKFGERPVKVTFSHAKF